jgi:ROS/MUCR transcriptional regulator protein
MENKSELVEFAADIVAAYVGNNSVPATELPNLINDVIRALNGAVSTGGEVVVEEARPAVPIKKSVTPDYIICLEDGKKFKSLKRHLRTHYDAGALSREVGPAAGLSDGRPQLCRRPLEVGAADGAWAAPASQVRPKRLISPRFQALCVAGDLAVAAPSIHKLKDCSTCRFAKGGRPPWRGTCRKGRSGLSS